MKMLNKKIISVILASVCCFVLAFSLTACQEEQTTVSVTSSRSSEMATKSREESKSAPKPKTSDSVNSQVNSQVSSQVSSNKSSSSKKPETSVDLQKYVDVKDVDYTESLENIANPEKGRFKLVKFEIKNSEDPGSSGSVKYFKDHLIDSDSVVKNNNLFLLSFGLEYYSTNMGGEDKDITAKGLTCIETVIKNCIEGGGDPIVRFSYDCHGEVHDSSSPLYKKDCEPKNLNQILKHIEQISPIINKYKANVNCVQSGMFGPWGEQHSTTLGNKENVDGYYQLVETWLNNTDNDVWIQVRRPLYFLHWYNTKYGKNFTTDNINSLVNSSDYLNDGLARRICSYNDGYLGSKSDLGTYTNRAKEIEWMKVNTFAPFGGEVSNESDGALNDYNKISALEVEAFKTHTAWLNYGWNYDEVIKYWEQETYNGSDPIYKGKTNSSIYVFNHLGYRLVLKSSRLSTEITNGKLDISGSINNVGFGNITRKQNVDVVIVNSNDNVVLTAPTSIDAQSFLSTQTVNYSQIIDVKSLSSGVYKAYMRISGQGQTGNGIRTIRFANNGNIYNQSLKANYIGSFSIA